MTRDEQRQQQQQRIDKVRYVKLALEGVQIQQQLIYLSVTAAQSALGLGAGYIVRIIHLLLLPPPPRRASHSRRSNKGIT